MKRILFISYDGMTDPLGQSQVIPYLIGLTRYGYSFTLLSSEKKEHFNNSKEYVSNLLKQYPIEWVPVLYHKFPPVLSSVYDYFVLRKKAAKLYAKSKFDMVHTRPGVPTLVALWLKKKYGLKFLNDIRGFWADERVDGGMWNLKNPLFKIIYTFFKKHEIECIELADYNTCLTFKAREEIYSWKTKQKEPFTIEVIPCSVDLDLFDPANVPETSKEQLRSDLGISKDDFVISYLGSIGGWYLVDEMMEFYKSLLDVIPDSRFLFISPHRHDFIINAASKYAIPANRIISRKARRDEVPALLSLSNFSIFFIRQCYSKMSSSPTKHGEIMAMDIPVITNDGVGDVSAIVNKYHSGLVINEMNKLTFSQVLNEITRGLSFESNAIREGAKEYYSLESAISKYLNVYKKILD